MEGLMVFFMVLLSITFTLVLSGRILTSTKFSEFWIASRVALSFLMVLTGVFHLLYPSSLVYMIEDILPAPEFLVLFSGLLEIMLGLVLLWEKTRKISAWLLIAQLNAMFPANINVAVNNLVAPGGMPSIPIYNWLRLFFQPVFVFWVYRTALARPGKSFLPVTGLGLLSLFLLSYNSAYQAYNCKVEVANLPEVEGVLYIGWYDKAEDFKKISKSAYKKVKKVNSESFSVVDFKNIKPGDYAISIFLDTNGNGVLDKNFLGIPQEPYNFRMFVY